jgi:hypothetical protein
MKKTLLISIVIFMAFFADISHAQNATYENLLDSKKGARIVDFSSNYESAWDVQNVLENAETSSYGELLCDH